MATEIILLTRKGTNPPEPVYVRTSSGAVNCNPNIWEGKIEKITPEQYIDPIDNTTKKTRVTLTLVLNKVPELATNIANEKIGKLKLSASSTSNHITLTLSGDDSFSTNIGFDLPTSPINLIQSSEVKSNYYDIVNKNYSETEAFSSLATIKILDTTVGWVKNEIDSL